MLPPPSAMPAGLKMQAVPLERVPDRYQRAASVATTMPKAILLKTKVNGRKVLARPTKTARRQAVTLVTVLGKATKVKVEDKGFSQVVDYEKTVQMDKHFSRNF